VPAKPVNNKHGQLHAHSKTSGSQKKHRFHGYPKPDMTWRISFSACRIWDS